MPAAPVNTQPRAATLGEKKHTHTGDKQPTRAYPDMTVECLKAETDLHNRAECISTSSPAVAAATGWIPETTI